LAALFQERIVEAQIHWGYVHVRRLGQRRRLAEQRAHGLLAQRPTLVEQLGQRLGDAAFAFLAREV
jgi:hypothetical protein